MISPRGEALHAKRHPPRPSFHVAAGQSNTDNIYSQTKHFTS
uniref:Uncharacterized protein n=1 Tax=Podoviridae sp. ctn7K25 TaxID=2825273 RepID=A0A8S5QD29_9CAUD|nr:MAG TPA: hypothetical protein [Podoviridae sp. ctn7K25]